MTRAPRIYMAAKVPGEAAAVGLALARLNAALRGAGGEPIATAPDDACEPWAILPVAVEALTPDADSAAQARLSAHVYATRRDAARIYLCTAFRRPGPDPERKRLRRLARLNCLAVTLSQRLGVFVIDVDRALAAQGARACAADFRLQSERARACAAREIAAALLASGVADHASALAQDAARAAIAAWRPGGASGP